MTRFIEAPLDSGEDRRLFLAGGITGCPDWQMEMMHLLAGLRLTVYNPRRANFPIHDPNAARSQIEWEHRHLWRADAILFWFPCESLCPIVLYELGAWSMARKPIFVGVHPDYKRRRDVEIQMGLVRPAIEVIYSLENLARQVQAWAGIPTKPQDDILEFLRA